MKGLIKSPLEYFNMEASILPTELGAWMAERGLTTVTVYAWGFVTTFHLVNGIAKEQ